jgi:hypothetical protein
MIQGEEGQGPISLKEAMVQIANGE